MTSQDRLQDEELIRALENEELYEVRSRGGVSVEVGRQRPVDDDTCVSSITDGLQNADLFVDRMYPTLNLVPEENETDSAKLFTQQSTVGGSDQQSQPSTDNEQFSVMKESLRSSEDAILKATKMDEKNAQIGAQMMGPSPDDDLAHKLEVKVSTFQLSPQPVEDHTIEKDLLTEKKANLGATAPPATTSEIGGLGDPHPAENADAGPSDANTDGTIHKPTGSSTTPSPGTLNSESLRREADAAIQPLPQQQQGGSNLQASRPGAFRSFRPGYNDHSSHHGYEEEEEATTPEPATSTNAAVEDCHLPDTNDATDKHECTSSC
ncbi:expressed unknown protein [Seminavis robusta]|uniref:Uncharacterized protein n=1 Tax=Seminavis robusta TaxID=568900 RepID=A0A9N8EUX4_9STRA|nr:expressed unknown protein [Seminavis robusta]|eukprot:Sro1835_g300620.1 n/a (322) ;mRNA; f:18073-19123